MATRIGTKLRLTEVLDSSGLSRFWMNILSMSGAQIAIRVSRLLTTIIIARHLAPADYGLAAVVLTTYELVAFFTRNGISAKVIQASSETVLDAADTACTMTWIICATLAITQAAIAVLVALHWQNASLGIAIALMGLVYFATPLSNIQAAFLQRESRLGRIAATGAIQVIADNALTALLVTLGYGMWAIVAPKLIVAPIWVIGLRYGHSWRARRWQLKGWKDIAIFSRSVLGIEFLTTVQTNVDNLIVGHMLGLEALGFYYFAYNAGLGLTLGLVNACGTAVYPHLCAVRSDARQLRQRYYQSLKGLGRFLLPVILCQVALAPFYVPIVFGEKWAPAISVLVLVCLSAMARPFAVVTSQLLKASNRPDIELRWQLALTPLLVLGLFAGSAFGTVGVASALFVIQGGMLTAFILRAPRSVLRSRAVAADAPKTTPQFFAASKQGTLAHAS